MTTPDIWTVVRMLEWATDYFQEREVPSPRLSIEWLLSHVLNVKRLELYLIFDRPLTEEELSRLRGMVKRRANHEPLQYICGETTFLDCRLEVNPSVLIPRQETEQLVHLFLSRHHDSELENPVLLDIGTGSGCIPISIQSACPGWACHGIDLSEEALQTARKNAERNQTDTRFHQFDLTNLLEKSLPIQGPIHWILSNPPYIHPEESESMEREVLEFEPTLALFDDDPLRFYRTILHFAARHLDPEGALYLECNPIDMVEIQSIADPLFAETEVLKDLDSRERFLCCRKIR